MSKQFFSRARNRVALIGVAASGLVLSTVHAAVDVTAVTTDLGDVKTAVLAIGVATLAIYVGIKLYKYVKQAL